MAPRSCIWAALVCVARSSGGGTLTSHKQTKQNKQVASSFSHMLNLHNLTEEVANTQTERAGRMGEVRCGCVGVCARRQEGAARGGSPSWR